MTGKPLHFEVVSGVDARKDPLMPDADLDTNYIKVTLARPVPTDGQGRLVIIKTYEDRKSYTVDGGTIIFDRPLGIRRNKVVLPAGYEVVGLTVPSQILIEADGRIGVSFVNGTEGEAPLVLRAAKGAQTGAAAAPKAATQQRSWESPFEGETGGEGAVPDDGDDTVLPLPEIPGDRHPEGRRDRRAGVPRAEGVARAFGDAGKSGDPPEHPQRREKIPPTGEDLVGIGLVPYIPQDPVPRAVEHVVEGDREFHHAEARCEVPPRARDVAYDRLAQFRGDARKPVARDLLQFGRRLDRHPPGSIRQRHFLLFRTMPTSSRSGSASAPNVDTASSAARSSTEARSIAAGIPWATG